MIAVREVAQQMTKLYWRVVGLSLLLTLAAWQISAQIAEERAKDQFEYRVQQLNGLTTANREPAEE